MSKDYLLGIDIGTSACKVAIFDKNGQVMASANGDYPVITRMRDGHSRNQMSGGMQYVRLLKNA